MTLGQLVKLHRERAGLSLQDLADAAGSSKAHIHSIEHSVTVNISLMLATRLSIALGVPVNALAAAALESVP
jgi:transcriptional regulator with XRE-family HTH domain